MSLVVFCSLAESQAPPNPATQEPPEEDLSIAEKQEYVFNPIQAAKELRVGNFYAKKGSNRAAARRFEEATRWDPNLAEAWLKLGDTQEKLGDRKAARTAWLKYLELEPDSKQANELRKKIDRK